MKYLLLVFSMVVMLFASCSKQSSSPTNTIKANAEIIAFRADKCGCCWGWIIRMGEDTIKVDSLPDAEAVGYNISAPIPVYLELGNIKQDCSSIVAVDPVIAKSYYSIKRLEIIH